VLGEAPHMGFQDGLQAGALGGEFVEALGHSKAELFNGRDEKLLLG